MFNVVRKVEPTKVGCSKMPMWSCGVGKGDYTRVGAQGLAKMGTCSLTSPVFMRIKLCADLREKAILNSHTNLSK